MSDTAAAPVQLVELLGGSTSRRARMVLWILDHHELDELLTKGKLIFDLGRRPGSGGPAVAVAFHPVSEEL